MPRPVEGSSPYNPGLDGIRAIAVVGVIAYHLNFGWASGGLLGVGVFFVLSGYLITDLLVAEYRRLQKIHLGLFWLRRARRLLPALLVMLFVVVVWATLFDRSQLGGLRTNLLPGIFYISNWWFIYHHVSYFARFGPPSPLGHLWSLAVEEQFYLFWPLILLAALRWVKDKRVIIAGILAVAAASALEMAILYSPVTDPTRVYDGTDTRAFALLIGAALALVWPRGRSFGPISPGARRYLELIGVVSLLGIAALYWHTSQADAFIYRGGMVVLSVLTALVIAVCVHPGARLSEWLGVQPLRWIGERSYAIYLWQFPVIILSTRQNAGPSYGRAALQVAAIFIVSGLSWHFIEQPVRLGALGPVWRRLRQRDWTLLRPRRWEVASAVGVGAVICALGLSGLVSGSAVSTTVVKSILPPKHHVDPTTTVAGSVPPNASTTTTALPPAGQGVTAIGDSIMIDMAPDLQRMLPGIIIDAQVGQQLYQVQSQVAQLKAAGDIGNQLILELGTNEFFSVAQLESLLNSLGPMKKIVLANTRVPEPWEIPVNQTIATVAQTYPNATLVDWYTASANQPQYFEPDGIHLSPAGSQYYATLITQALEAPPPPPPTTTTTTVPKKNRSTAVTTTTAPSHTAG
jgi:peptidoglycan/LPS O-acetylase OafA/YrhL